MVVLSPFVYSAWWQAVHYAGNSNHSTVRETEREREREREYCFPETTSQGISGRP